MNCVFSYISLNDDLGDLNEYYFQLILWCHILEELVYSQIYGHNFHICVKDIRSYDLGLIQ